MEVRGQGGRLCKRDMTMGEVQEGAGDPDG
jgi:hypothetical protein